MERLRRDIGIVNDADSVSIQPKYVQHIASLLLWTVCWSAVVFYVATCHGLYSYMFH